MDIKKLRQAGRYFRATHPEGHAMWRKDEREAGRPTDLAAAGMHFMECDPEGFDRIIS